MTCKFCERPVSCKGMCKMHANAKWRQDNRLRVSEYNARYNAANKERIAEWHARPENKELQRSRSTEWAKANPEKIASAQKKHRANNPGRNNASAAKHKAAKILATPNWANSFFIAEAYRLASLRTKMLGFAWHVDHIVPLRSKIVCGLHWERNLQVIPGTVNCSKSNRRWPDMPSSRTCRSQVSPVAASASN